MGVCKWETASSSEAAGRSVQESKVVQDPGDDIKSDQRLEYLGIPTGPLQFIGSSLFSNRSCFDSGSDLRQTLHPLAEAPVDLPGAAGAVSEVFVALQLGFLGAEQRERFSNLEG